MNTESRTERISRRRDDVGVLLGVAKRLKRALKPVPAKSAFRARLRDGLMMAAHHRGGMRHQQAHRLTIESRARSRLGWVVGAAALGSAGIIALVLHSRQSQRATAARVTTESTN